MELSFNFFLTKRERAIELGELTSVVKDNTTLDR